jgi:hypothetical protein
MKCQKFSNSNGYNIRLTSSPRYQSAQDADGVVLSVFARTGREDAVLHPNLSLESEKLKKAGFTAHCTSCHMGFSPGQIDSKIRRHWQLYKGKPHRRRTWPKVESPELVRAFPDYLPALTDRIMAGSERATNISSKRTSLVPTSWRSRLISHRHQETRGNGT